MLRSCKSIVPILSACLLLSSFASCPSAGAPGAGQPNAWAGQSEGAGEPYSGAAASGDFYVDSAAGSDSNPGTEAAPWKSLGRIGQATLSPGCRVHLRRGSAWRECLPVQSGAEGRPVAYLPYGDAASPPPLIMASLSRSAESDWSPVAGTGLWRAMGYGAPALDVGNVLWVGGGRVLAYGRKKFAAADCLSPGDYWYDRAADAVELRCASNPALLRAGASVELALDATIADFSGKSWVYFSGLDLRYSGKMGFNGMGASRITVADCDISWIGGCELQGSAAPGTGHGKRYGNGVQFFGDAADCLVEGNRVREIYDTGLTNQCYFDSTERDITYRGNVVWNCGYASFEFWNSGAASVSRNIRFEGNTCYGAGEGWGGDQARPDANTAGAHLRFDDTSSATSGLVVRNNIFSEARVACALVIALGSSGAGSWAGWPSLDMDYNCWQGSVGKPIWLFASYSAVLGSYGPGELGAYRAALGKDARSIVGDPLFVDAGAGNFRLAPGSPCWGAGSESGSPVDMGAPSRSAPGP